MRIYVDVDDVLCETAAHLCEIAAREFGRHVAYKDVFQFDLQEVFDLTDAEMARFMTVSHESDSLLAHPVTPGAPEGLRALRAAGHEVEIVTGRPASAHRPTATWLARVGLADFPVTYVDKYGRDACYPHHPEDPLTVSLAELLMRRYDVVIDDSPKVLEHLATAWPQTRILVFSRPWNRNYPLSDNMSRVADWKSVLAGVLD